MSRSSRESPLCRGCNEELTRERDSETHIIPNALGGSLAPKGILCHSGNGALNELADKPLIKAFGAWPTLINVPRDRDGNPAVTIETTSGQRIRQIADGTRTRVDHVYDIAEIGEGHAVNIITQDRKTMRQRIAQARKQFPQLDSAEALSHAVKMKAMPEGMEHLPVNFSAPMVFPGIFAALWLFCIHKTGHELMPWSKLVNLLVRLREGKLDLSLRYLPHGLPGLRGPEVPIAHQVVLRTVPKKGLLIGYVQILDALRVGGILVDKKAPSSLEEHIYVDDVFGPRRDRTDEFAINGEVFDATDWWSIGLGIDAPLDELKNYVLGAMTPLIERKKLREEKLKQTVAG